MIVAFHTNQICLQGTEIALYDYAHFNEVMLGNKSIIISKNNKLSTAGGAGKNQPLALQKFRDRFQVFLYDHLSELDNIISSNKVDVFYAIKKGVKDGVESKKVKTVIHAVFKYYEPHGDAYAYVSKWLSDEMTGGKAPYVPHMIYLPRVNGDLRIDLNIPDGATVFGRYGGMNSFDIPFVHEEILRFLNENENIYFLFMNTNDFMNPQDTLWKKLKSSWNTKTHPRIIFLPGTSSMGMKSKFINTCDAMLHARLRGETFGIAVGEFSVNNVPVITYKGRQENGFEGNHIEILGDQALIYENRLSLRKCMTTIVNDKKNLSLKNWDAYSKDYSPENVMKKFAQVFLS